MKMLPLLIWRNLLKIGVVIVLLSFLGIFIANLNNLESFIAWCFAGYGAGLIVVGGLVQERFPADKWFIAGFWVGLGLFVATYGYSHSILLALAILAVAVWLAIRAIRKTGERVKGMYG